MQLRFFSFFNSDSLSLFGVCFHFLPSFFVTGFRLAIKFANPSLNITYIMRDVWICVTFRSKTEPQGRRDGEKNFRPPFRPFGSEHFACFSPPFTHTHTHTHAHAHTRTHTHARTHTHTVCLSVSFTSDSFERVFPAL